MCSGWLTLRERAEAEAENAEYAGRLRVFYSASCDHDVCRRQVLHNAPSDNAHVHQVKLTYVFPTSSTVRVVGVLELDTRANHPIMHTLSGRGLRNSPIPRILRSPLCAIGYCNRYRRATPDVRMSACPPHYPSTFHLSAPLHNGDHHRAT